MTLTPAEHCAKAEENMAAMTGGPGAMAWHGLALSAITHLLAAGIQVGTRIADGLDVLAEILEPDPAPDFPGLPLGWRVTTGQSENGKRLWGYVITDADGTVKARSRRQWGSSPAAAAAGLRDPAIPPGDGETP